MYSTDQAMEREETQSSLVLASSLPSVISTVPGLEDRLVCEIEKQAIMTKRVVGAPVPELQLNPNRKTIIVYRDLGIPVLAARNIANSLGVPCKGHVYDSSKDNGAYTSLDHHILDDSMYKYALNPLVPSDVVFIGARAKQNDSTTEKTAKYYHEKGTVHAADNPRRLIVGDVHGVKIVVKNEDAVYRTVEKLLQMDHFYINNPLTDVDVKYANGHEIKHNDVDPDEIPFKFSRDPAYRAVHLNVILNDPKNPSLNGMELEIQVVDEEQWMYNYWEHKNKFATRRADRTPTKKVNNDKDMVFVEGTASIWEQSPEFAKTKIIRSNRAMHINGGRVLAVSQGKYTPRYIHINNGAYQ